MAQFEFWGSVFCLMFLAQAPKNSTIAVICGGFFLGLPFSVSGGLCRFTVPGVGRPELGKRCCCLCVGCFGVFG